MRGLSSEIETALNTIIEGLNYKFFEISTEKENVVEPERMKSLATSKIDSLKGAKKILKKWADSNNRPSDEKLEHYIQRIVDAGDNSISTLRNALTMDIDFKKLEAHKHTAAINSKPVILTAIFDIEDELRELREKLEMGDLSLEDKEFKLGFPERFANSESYPLSDYYKKRLNTEKDVLIDPKSTEGERIVLMDLGIILPEVPEGDILFSDLPKEEQHWRRIEPPRITTTNIQQHEEYILEEYRRRREGLWFMNNGVPTYLTGNHYWALQWCKMLDDGAYMNYREAQRDLFYFMEACIVDNNSLGILLLKSRRTGFTYSALAIILNLATATKNGKYGMMSKSETDGGEAFAKIAYMLISLPFWLRPIIRGKIDSTKSFFFSQPADNTKKAKKEKTADISEYLNTSLDYRATRNGSYDSIKLSGYLLDEIFKLLKPNDAIIHLGMVRPTMMPSGRVVGKMFAGSTMGGFNEGGEQGIDLINGSHVKDRDKITKQTATGLYLYFIPAQDNMEQFTDVYGCCWKEPLKEGENPLNVFGEPIQRIGSNGYLDATEDKIKKQGDKAYNEQKRTYPRNMDDAMRDLSEGCVYNMQKLYEQKEYNERLPEIEKYQVGNFEWDNGIRFSKVVFYPNSRGRFKVYWLPSVVDGTEHLANNVKKVGDRYYPLNGDIVRFGTDPFSVKGSEGSKGGNHGKTLHFPAGGAPSNKFVLEYLFRPPDDTTFFEDMLKSYWYYGAPALIESNRIDLNRYLRNAGCRGFAMNRLDRTKLTPHEQEYGGQPMSGKDMLDSHMNAIGSWIENYVGYSNLPQIRPIGEMGTFPFNDTIMDWLRFNPEKRTKHDATISSGLAIMACQSEKYKKKKTVVKKDISKIFKKYNTSKSPSRII